MPIWNKKELQGFVVKNNGFTLVEMSIVILVISLLLAAITKGQSLIDEAKLQSIVAEVSQNKVAINSFYAKYNQYPGDYSDAAATWGGAYTASGDNNGQIEFKNTAGSPVYEGYRAWAHLYFSGMLETPYTGTTTTGAAVPNADIPASKAGGGYLLDYSSSPTGYDHLTANAYGFSAKNVMLLGTAAATTVSPLLVNGVLTPSQAMGVDAKMDDGAPTTGNVRGADGNASTAGNCISTIYKVSLTGKDCIMVFRASD